jgi:hypothetical protein
MASLEILDKVTVLLNGFRTAHIPMAKSAINNAFFVVQSLCPVG